MDAARSGDIAAGAPISITAESRKSRRRAPNAQRLEVGAARGRREAERLNVKAESRKDEAVSTMTQRLKNHSDEPPSILVWTFRAPIPRPGSVGDRTRGWGARREVPGGAYH